MPFKSRFKDKYAGSSPENASVVRTLFDLFYFRLLPFHFSDTVSRKTLFFLTQTLNAAFAPDYDFSSAKGEDFSREPKFDWVMANIDSCLFQTSGQGNTTPWSGFKDCIRVRQNVSFRNCRYLFVCFLTSYLLLPCP